MIIVVVLLAMLAVGGVAFAFAGGDERSQKARRRRGQAHGQRRRAAKAQADAAQKRKNVAALLKDVEKNQARKKEKPTMRRRLEQAGFPNATPRTFWIICGVLGVSRRWSALSPARSPLVTAAGGVRRELGPAALGAGLPHRPRRKKNSPTNSPTPST